MIQTPPPTGPHIGIVAGTAEGAALCYRTLCHEAEEILGLYAHPEITMHTFPLNMYLARIDDNDWAGVAALMSLSAARLAQAGADLIICPNNTVHQAFDSVVSTIPWLHIAAAVEAEVAQSKFQRVGLLGTQTVMQGAVYGPTFAKRGIEVVLPEPHERIHLDRIIRTELIRGRSTPRSHAYVNDIIARMASKSAQAIILGCTELPILLAEEQSAVPMLDSTRILARAALQRVAPSRFIQTSPAGTSSTAILTAM